MNKAKLKQAAKQRRVRRVRSKIKGTADCPRLTVRRSLKHIYVQVIDDVAGKTLTAVSDSEMETKNLSKLEVAALIGKTVAEKAKAKGIASVVFDRRDKRYHGMIKAVAEGAREGGLKF